MFGRLDVFVSVSTNDKKLWDWTYGWCQLPGGFEGRRGLLSPESGTGLVSRQFSLTLKEDKRLRKKTHGRLDPYGV